MLSTEASAMSGLSGANLGCILTLFVNLAGCIILAYLPIPPKTSNSSIAYDWKLGLVATSLFPLTVSAGYLRFAMSNKLNQKLQKAYENSAYIVCEQVASMRTIASLNREVALHEEFMQSLKAPVLKAIYFTLKIASVCPFFPDCGFRFTDVVLSCLLWDNASFFLQMH
jgi:ABC-type multidrug transport system fused ATPase/permease subunit